MRRLGACLSDDLNRALELARLHAAAQGRAAAGLRDVGLACVVVAADAATPKFIGPPTPARDRSTPPTADNGRPTVFPPLSLVIRRLLTALVGRRTGLLDAATLLDELIRRRLWPAALNPCEYGENAGENSDESLLAID